MRLLLLLLLFGDKGQFDYDAAGRTVRVWTYVPEGATPDSPVVVVLHGVLRNGEEYREPWIALADRYRCVVLVSEFSKEAWPGSRAYNQGNILDEKDRPVAEEKWAYSAVDGLFEKFRKDTGHRAERYFIFGHSAGAQFLHRMMLLKPDAKVELAVVANAGCYSMPDLEIAWPYGLKGTTCGAERLRKALSRRVVVLLGEKDTDPNDRYLPREKEAMAQGEHRLARGRKFFEAAKAAGGEGFAWRLETLPDVGHDNKKMAPAAARLMFEKK